ncbi:hypothetical protein J2S58_002128 [Nakamurella flavida]|uniref:DUF4438 family protein n=1 Tax=Nakamurella flavida TaxID=363630 RepID=UPI0027816800|nr:DUF4438 domain-containing protein [Nakamurella flavida]MDP9778505.1 hypothetical protein [Nakamurella flavida]
MSVPRTVGVNLAGFIESPEFGGTPYRIGADGRPYVPVGDGGIVLGVQLGDGVFDHVGDHLAPGVTLMHPDQGARHALTSFSCAGNEVVVRGGAAAGAVGRVLGKRGEAGRVIVVFPSGVLTRLAPGDPVMVRSHGQGSVVPSGAAAGGVVMVNADPALLERVGIEFGDQVGVPVRGVVDSRVVGNGMGRPVEQWDVDLTLTAATADRWGMAGLRLGDLVAVENLDVRHNIGFRRGWITVGVVVHGGSPQPGHGPGLMPVLCGPADAFDLRRQPDSHRGVTVDRLEF